MLFSDLERQSHILFMVFFYHIEIDIIFAKKVHFIFENTLLFFVAFKPFILGR